MNKLRLPILLYTHLVALQMEYTGQSDRSEGLNRRHFRCKHRSLRLKWHKTLHCIAQGVAPLRFAPDLGMQVEIGRQLDGKVEQRVGRIAGKQFKLDFADRLLTPTGSGNNAAPVEHQFNTRARALKHPEAASKIGGKRRLQTRGTIEQEGAQHCIADDLEIEDARSRRGLPFAARRQAARPRVAPLDGHHPLTLPDAPQAKRNPPAPQVEFRSVVIGVVQVPVFRRQRSQERMLAKTFGHFRRQGQLEFDFL